jgi:hypothetical protein
MTATDRNAVSSASDFIDADAHLKGNPVHEGFRFLIAPPLRAHFSVRQADRVVEVLRVDRM